MLKKLLIAMFIALMLSSAAYAQSNDDTCAEYWADNGRNQGVLYLECTADSGDGSLSYTTNKSLDGLVYAGIIIPGSTTFTASVTDVDITYTVTAGWDGPSTYGTFSGGSYTSGNLFGTNFDDLDNAAANHARPNINSNDVGMPVQSKLSVALGDNAVNSARFLLIILYYK